MYETICEYNAFDFKICEDILDYSSGNYDFLIQPSNYMYYASISSLDFDQQLLLWSLGGWDKNTNIAILKYTPPLYIKLGLENRPITITPNKLDRIVNFAGKQKNQYHGLGLDILKQIPYAIAHPLKIVISNTEVSSIVIITNLIDCQGRKIIIPLLINGKGNVKVYDFKYRIVNKNVSTNVMTSAYGRNNFDTWMKSNKYNKRIIYDYKLGILKKRINGKWINIYH